MGEQVGLLFAGQPLILTHHTNQKFASSIEYDFFTDAPDFLPDEPSTVIFTSAVETSEATERVREAMSRLLPFVQRHRFIYLSSDGIFSGRSGYYSEEDEPKPRTLYGRNLLTCESLIRQTLNNYSIIRPSYICGRVNGRLDNRLSAVKAKLLAGESIVGFRDVYKSPLGVKQLAQAVVDVATSQFTGVLHVAGERMSVYDFYQQAMTTLGMDTSNLLAEAAPLSPTLLKDTSLNVSKWTELFGATPMSVRETLNNTA